ncbi:uncharacterized protein LOC141698717 [Apium graveolens]|uniref:uncharacterized protein LOC141698717 n=1 Tax=Apium graveolens TaxID=4045 RepID=UPI003D78F5D2
MGLTNKVMANEDSTVLGILQGAFQMSSREQCTMIGMICWSLWRRRNNWLWRKASMSTFGVKGMAMNMLSDWRRAKEKEDITRIPLQLRSTGCVVRDSAGSFLRAKACKVRNRAYAMEAEAVRLKEALSWVKDWRTSKCIFETDAKLLVDVMHSPKQGRSFFDTLVDDCKELVKHFEEVLIVFTHRSANNVAHILAQAAYSLIDPREWINTAPDFIICTLSLEAI